MHIAIGELAPVIVMAERHIGEPTVEDGDRGQDEPAGQGTDNAIHEFHIVGEIARLFSVHQSTITRQLDRVVDRLRNDVKALLASEYRLNLAQVDECLVVACDTFATSVSILGLLKEGAARNAPAVAAF